VIYSAVLSPINLISGVSSNKCREFYVYSKFFVIYRQINAVKCLCLFKFFVIYRQINAVKCLCLFMFFVIYRQINALQCLCLFKFSVIYRQINAVKCLCLFKFSVIYRKIYALDLFLFIQSFSSFIGIKWQFSSQTFYSLLLFRSIKRSKHAFTEIYGWIIGP
jgi:hypothetical protein